MPERFCRVCNHLKKVALMIVRTVMKKIIVISILMLAALAAASEPICRPGMWKGQGDIIVGWCNQRHLPFELRIDETNIVTGFIGDASVKGELKMNRAIYRMIGNKKYIIDAELTGCIVKAENIQRKSIRLFLDIDDTGTTLNGGMHTSGCKIGGKEFMVLSGMNIVLTLQDN